MSFALIVAFDGLQPAQVTTEVMPNLSRFAADGVTFSNHHPVFPTVTRINAASMVTGRYPGAHGLAANTLVVRDYDPYLAFSALEPMLAKVAQKTGHVLLVPTLGDILSRQGMEYIAVGAGTTGNAYVHNPNAELSGGATIHPEFSLPYPLYDEIVERVGPWPDDAMPNTPRLSHAVDILTKYVIAERKPAVSFVWFSEPDHAQHAHGVGSDIATRAIHEADAQFGRILAHLDEIGLRADTDVFVISDHGYSTIREVISIENLVREAGFPPGDQNGGVVVAPNGGSALFYVHDKDLDTADRLATWLMAQQWCGSLVASDATGNIPGTLPASLVGTEGPRVPELAMSFKWDSTPNAKGFAGHAFSSGGAAGLGQHGSMSRHEMRNVLFANGPRFKTGVVVDSPTGNIDLAPTILRVLGGQFEATFDGRPLLEALIETSGDESVQWSQKVYTAERKVDGGTYRQEITISTVGNTSYIDQGTATLES